MTDIFDQRVIDAQRNRELLDTQISQTLAALQIEQDLQKEGYANNVTAKKQELDRLTALRDEALAKEKAAIEAQQRLDTILQTTNLITSISQIFKSLIKALGPLGIPVAVAVSAAMLAAFIAAKAKAKAATKVQ